MNRTYLLLVVLFAFAKAATAQVTDPKLNYYLKSDNYDKSIPTPQEVIGFVPGKWHVTHDKLVQYMYALAAASDRISIENRGVTYEDRPLVLLTITSAQNQSNIESIRTEHMAATDLKSQTNGKRPIVIYQGFSIHGNESSGSNAALLYAYHLAASKDDQVLNYLDNTVILLDPSMNPDGLQRFAGWVNQHKSELVNPDNYDREYSEVWPGGRTNHYWFDMNRDWLPVQLPESQARIQSFHKWLPNILTDHHEMGTNSTFFFQPGIPSRTHPLTPQQNQNLTEEIGTYHAKAFDKIGSLYYSKESFDDFYYGKGSTFPDINGSIGILFEQASSRGHAQNSVNGVLTFPFTIKNQLTAALSTLEAANSMREKILDYQSDFYAKAREEVKGNKQAIIVGSPGDKNKLKAFANILERHQIKFMGLDKSRRIDQKSFDKEYSLVIPYDQKNHRLLKAMFDKRTSFQDSLFYDVSAWTFPYAFDLDYSLNAKKSWGKTSIDKSLEKIESSAYAYLIPWTDYLSPALLYELLDNKLQVKTAMQPFSTESENFSYGTLMVSTQNQPMNSDELVELLNRLQSKYQIKISAVESGLSDGINLGSRQFRNVTKPKIALLVGDGINPYDAGEIWHLMDQRYHIPITKIDIKSIRRRDLSKYTTIIVPNTYGTPDKGVIDKIKSWTRSGGTVIGYRSALRWMNKEGLLKIEYVETENPAKNISFEDRGAFNGAQVIGGAIFETNLDLSHPITFGYNDEFLPMFRNTTIFVKADERSYNNPIKYTEKPLLSGYSSNINLEAIKNTVPFKSMGYGRGQVVGFTDNTQFRAFWYGTNRLMMNAIFFSDYMN